MAITNEQPGIREQFKDAQLNIISMDSVEKGINDGTMFHPLVRSHGSPEYIRAIYYQNMIEGNFIIHCPTGLEVDVVTVAGSVITKDEIPVISCKASAIPVVSETILPAKTIEAVSQEVKQVEAQIEGFKFESIGMGVLLGGIIFGAMIGLSIIFNKRRDAKLAKRG